MIKPVKESKQVASVDFYTPCIAIESTKARRKAEFSISKPLISQHRSCNRWSDKELFDRYSRSRCNEYERSGWSHTFAPPHIYTHINIIHVYIDIDLSWSYEAWERTAIYGALLLCCTEFLCRTKKPRGAVGVHGSHGRRIKGTFLSGGRWGRDGSNIAAIRIRQCPGTVSKSVSIYGPRYHGENQHAILDSGADCSQKARKTSPSIRYNVSWLRLLRPW